VTSPDPLDPLLTLEEFASILKVSVRTTRRLHALGKLPQAMRIGTALRWRREVIDEFLRTGAKPERRGVRK